MKRNDLRAMGLTPDQIDTIMTMNGVDINREQVARGMAWVYRRYNQEPAYYEAEAAAKAARLGLWADTNPVPPWDYRHDQAGAREHARVAPSMTN